MPQKSPIEWTDYTSNPIYAVNKQNGKRGWFCEKISPGCGHCYACGLNRGRFGNGLDFVPANAKDVEFVLNEKELLAIIKLDRKLAKAGERAKLFPFDMTDLFLEHHPDEYLDKFFAVAALCQNIDFQVLTKRAERMHEYFATPDRKRTIAAHVMWISNGLACDAKSHDARIRLDDFSHCFAGSGVFPNIWLGVSVENQQYADERIPYLLQTPAAIRFLSIEPMIGEVDLEVVDHSSYGWLDVIAGMRHLQKPTGGVDGYSYRGVDWAIIGGESGSHARRFNLDWCRSIIKQFKSADLPVFVKQLGKVPEGSREDWTHINQVPLMNAALSMPLNFNDKKGGDMAEWPEDLRVRQFPKTVFEHVVGQ